MRGQAKRLVCEQSSTCALLDAVSRLIHSELDSYELSALTSKSFPVSPSPKGPGDASKPQDITRQSNPSESLKQDLEASKMLFDILQARMQGLEDAFRSDIHREDKVVSQCLKLVKCHMFRKLSEHFNLRSCPGWYRDKDS